MVIYLCNGIESNSCPLYRTRTISDFEFSFNLKVSLSDFMVLHCKSEVE